MANSNPFSSSPTDDLIAELTAQAAQPVKLPEPVATPKAVATPARAVSLPTDKNLPAGMRNNNPGNIKYAGQRDAVGPSQNLDQGDPQAVYATPEDGMAAMFRLVAKKYNGGKTTANTLIASRGGWTPGNTQAAANVARTMGLSPDDDLNLSDPAQMARFGRALMLQEHGPASKMYSDDMITAAVQGAASGKPVSGAARAVAAKPAPATEDDDANRYIPLDHAAFQQQLDADEPGRYRVITDDFAATHFSPALMDRTAYEQTFKANNPGASPAAVAYALDAFDKQQPKGPPAQIGPKAIPTPEQFFDQRLNEKLGRGGVGVVPALPGKLQPDAPAPAAPYDAAKADQESGMSAAASYLGHSAEAGFYDLAGAGAKILEGLTPTLSDADAAVLYKNDPAKLKEMQEQSTAMVLSRFAKAMTKNSEEAQAAMSDRAKRDYGGLEYATLDQGKAAYRSPVKVIGDTVRSLPTTVAMAVSVYFTRGAAAQAERQALAAGLSEEAARAAAVQAGAKAMASTGATSEGLVGYAQQANQTTSDVSKVPLSELAKSPKFQQLVQQEGFTPEAARAKIIADTAEQAGQIAGIADAAVNHYGGQFLGKILTEGGSLIPRIMKGAGNEAATETVQSAAEQFGQNVATQRNVDPNQSLSQGVGEAAVAGGAVGGLMGGVTAGAGGHAHDGVVPAAQPPAQPAAPAPAPVAPPTQVAPVPAEVAPAPKSATPLTSSLESTAQEPQRVIASTPDGQHAAGTVQAYHEDEQGHFAAQIVGDDGQVYTVTDADGVQLTPVAPSTGPLTGALEDAAHQHAAEQQAAVEEAPAAAPAPEQVPELAPAAPAPQAEAPVTPAAMSDEQLRTRLKYLASQFKGAADRSIQTKIALERRAIEKEINARAAQGVSDESGHADGLRVRDGRADGAENPAPARADQPTGRAGDQVTGGQGSTSAEAPAPGARADVPAANPTADAQPALKDEHAKRWFGSEDKARSYIAKQKIGATHRVEQTGRVRFEIRPKAVAGEGAEKLAAAQDKHAKQDEAVRQALEKAAARAAAKTEPAPVPVLSEPQTELDAAAHEAATSPHNDLPEPTDAQKEAGNYKVGRVRVHGLDISIENPEGSTRSGVDENGREWSSTIQNGHYGYIRRTEGADGDHVDVFVGPKHDSAKVFVVDQINQGDSSFDEHKVLLGYPNKQAAVRAYQSNFDPGWKVGPVKQMSVDEFKSWLKDGDTTKPAAEHITAAPTTQGDQNGIDHHPVQQPDGAEEVQRPAASQEAGAKQAGTEEEVSREKKPKAKAAAEPVAASEKAQPTPGEVPAAEPAAPATPIADFGEKIHGARKDIWTGFKESMSEALPSDVADITLAKHWPEPNYEKLIEAGVEPKVLAAFKALRDEVPAKPRMPYKARRWGEQVTTLRRFASELLDGTVNVDEAAGRMHGVLGPVRRRIELYTALGHPLFTKAKAFDVKEHAYSLFKGVKYDPPVTKFDLVHDGRTLDYFDTMDQVIEAARAKLEGSEDKPGGAKPVDLDLYRVTSTGDIVIGKKVAPGKFIDLKTGFKGVREARKYLATHKDELLALLEQKKDVRPERRGVNDPRVGIDRRQGADITPNTFGSTFGFRGVQFGNYVEQKRRAADLNNAYDALLDLADTIHVPPQALSLNGTLGLAFGARGKGGKNPAAAHYEAGHVVINLTKGSGAGSLAHEWWHGLDNYFSKQRGDQGGFISAYPQPKMKPDANRKMVADESVRHEALAAFKGVVDAIRGSGMVKRASLLDARRSKDYWSTIHELTARAFESYVIDKAAEQGHSNDFLANIVSEPAHEAMNGLTGDAQPFPYPTKAEKPAINAAFDKLFATLKTKEEGGKTALYSVADDAQAINEVMRAGEGAATIERDGIGQIALPYGDEKAGLAHIAARRGEAFMGRLPELLATGDIYTKPDQPGRVFIGNERDEAVIRLDRDGRAEPWLLSAYEKYPDHGAARSEALEERSAPGGDWLTPNGLKRAITRGPLGQVVHAMLDSGHVVLHRSAKTLPKDLNKVRGIQGVFTGDGKIHLVAGNLTPSNAMGVLLHEAFHEGAGKLSGTRQWSDMMGRMGSLYRQSERSSGRAREVFDKARARVAAAKAKGAVATKMEVEEFAAYAVEEYAKDPKSLPAALRKWVEDLIGMVKAYLAQRYGKQFGDVTPAQLTALAKFALIDHAHARRGEIFGPVGEWFSTKTDQTDTPAFQKWFGDSKVVDENGAPLLVYHGTRRDFTEFDMRNPAGAIGNPKGAYFTADKYVAQRYAENDDGEIDGKSKVIAAYLRIEDDSDGKIIDSAYRGREYVVFKPENIKLAIGNNGNFDPANPDIRYSVASDDAAVAPPRADTAEPDGLTPPEQGRLRTIQAAVQDNMNRVRQVQDRIAKLAGHVGERADYYLAETLRPGKIAARLEEAQKMLFGPLMQRLGKSGHTMAELEELLHAQHAEERNAAVARINDEHADVEKNPGSGMSDSEAKQIQAKYADNAEMQAMAQQARDIARATLDLKQAYGLLTPDDYKTLSEMYEHYVPLKGDGEYGPKVKRAMGHGERDEHILENIARDHEQAVVVGEKNLARQSLLRLVLQHPDPDLWTVGVPPKGRYVAGKVYAIFKGSEKVSSFTSRAQVQAFLEDRGANAGYTVKDSAGEQVTEFTRPLQDNEVMVYVNGDPVRIQLHDEKLARQLRPIINNRDTMRWVTDKLRSLNRLKANLYTGKNPSFILRNAARDAITGTLNITGHHGAVTAAKAWASYPAAWGAMLQYAATGKAPDGPMGKLLTEYRQHGGKVGASHMSDLEAQGKKLSRMFDDAYGAGGFLSDGRVGKAAWVGSRKLIGGLGHVVEVANQAFENALRLSLFATLRQQGASPARAAQAAKTVTVDFDRKGELTGALGALYLFINPAIQGTANMVKTMAYGEHKEQAWALAGAVALAGLAFAGKGMDDDRERWLGEDWATRTKNLIFYAGKHRISVPISQEYAPFYAAGVALAEARRGESAMKSSARLFSSFLDAYFPLQGAFNADSDNHGADLALAAVPTALRPHFEQAFNRSSFGSPIKPEFDTTKDRPDNLKMFRGTKGSVYDRASQGIATAGELLGSGKYENDLSKISPEQLKYLWRTYTGGLGQFITDSVGLAALVGEDPKQLQAGDFPIVKDFVKDQDSKPLRSRYYNLANETKQVAEEFRQASKAGDGDALDKIMSDERKEHLVGLAKLVTSTNKEAAALADEKVNVAANDNLSGAEKRVELDKLDQQEEALYREAIGALK